MENVTVFIAHHMGLFYAFSAALLALMLVEFIRAKRGQARLAPTDAVLMINKKNAIVIDIRANEIFRKGHIVDALSVPAHDLTEASKKLDKYKSKPVIVVCSNGVDSQKAAANLTKQGYTAFILTGGMRAWSGAALPLVKE